MVLEETPILNPLCLEANRQVGPGPWKDSGLASVWGRAGGGWAGQVGISPIESAGSGLGVQRQEGYWKPGAPAIWPGAVVAGGDQGWIWYHFYLFMHIFVAVLGLLVLHLRYALAVWGRLSILHCGGNGVRVAAAWASGVGMWAQSCSYRALKHRIIDAGAHSFFLNIISVRMKWKVKVLVNSVWPCTFDPHGLL